MTRLASAVALCLLLNGAAPLYAATYYVSNGGDDGRSCPTATSELTPRATLTGGQACLGPGDTLLVRGAPTVAGFYDETLQFTTPSGTDWTNKVRIAAYPGETVWLTPSNSAPWGTAVEFGYGQHYIEFDGININAALVTADGVKIDNFTDGMMVNQTAHHIRLKNLIIKNMPGFGIVNSALFAGAIGYNEFQNVTVYCSLAESPACTASGGAFTHLIYLQTSFNLVEFATLFDSMGNGIQIRCDDFDTCSDNVLRYNVIHDLYRDNGDGRHRGIVISAGNRNKAYGNLIYNISYPSVTGFDQFTSAIEVVYAKDTEVYNNTAWNGNRYGYRSEGDITTGTIWRNNISFGFTSGNFFDGTDYGGGKTMTASNNVTATDPLFVDAANNNFQLKPGSPAVDAGFDLSAIFATDLAGRARPQGAAFDVGAFELLFRPSIHVRVH